MSTKADAKRILALVEAVDSLAQGKPAQLGNLAERVFGWPSERVFLAIDEAVHSGAIAKPGAVVKVVLLFSNVARADLAARLHAPSCSMVQTSKGRRGRLTRIDDPTEEDIADLNDRGWPVKRCKCLPKDAQS